MILVTDGEISFAILNYEDYSVITATLDSLSVPYESGFDAGDAQRSAQLLIRNDNISELYYRIDGKCTC